MDRRLRIVTKTQEQSATVALSLCAEPIMHIPMKVHIMFEYTIMGSNTI